MENFFHPTFIEIDLKQFEKNILEIKKITKNNIFCLPVKANAYGLGALEISKKALEVGVDYLGVSCLKEALELRQNNIKAPILIFGAIHKDQIKDIVENNIEITISSKFKADLLIDFLKNKNKQAYVHIETDTGMNRTGSRKDTAKKLYYYLKKQKNINIVGIYSHLATANIKNDSFCKNQIKTFYNLVKEIDPQKKLISHLANSSSFENYPSSFKNTQMTRIGILSYGYPLSSKLKSKIKPIFSLKSHVSFFKVVKGNKGISYSHSYKTQTQTRIVTIPIGYADGYKRDLSNKQEVLIKGKRHKIAGNICMDQMMVDIGQNEAYVDEEVILIGNQKKEKITLEEIAKNANTIIYDIISSFSKRISRKYKK